ncbi:hypothetical protein OQA88_8803 [Cercophora sp. LCS_1]
MATEPISHDEFFTKLTTLFASRKAKDHGGVLLTQKRYAPPDTIAVTDTDTPQTILVRATNRKGRDERGEKIKLLTLVEPSDLDGFFARYAEVCKTGMGGLKPRDRTKRRAKQKKKKGVV